MTDIAAGAEARIIRDDDIVRKERIEKRYRHPELDRRLREERTQDEARMLKKAYQAGVRVPTVHAVEDTTFEMDHIDGTLVKEIFSDRDDLWPVIGEQIARLHNRNVIHGDLTTSNMLYDSDRGEVYFIDFGLGYHSQRIEDKAVDLHLLHEVLDSTHTDVADDAMATILDVYREQCDTAEQVLERYDDIKDRGRYK